MNRIDPRPLVLSALALASCLPGARAHGDAPHAAPPRTFDAARGQDTSFGRPGDPGRIGRTVRVDMADTMRFTPAENTVRRGETVRIVAANTGRVLHELVLGTPRELEQHAALMKQFPGMEHEEAHMTHVKPGHSGEIVWQFTTPGEFAFACLMPGHFEAGMVGKVIVE